MVARLRRGAFSLLTTTAIGTRLPNPRHAKNRSTMSSVRSFAWVTASVRRENQITVPSIIGRRPNRSVSGPVKSAPSATPMIPAVKTGANSWGKGWIYSPKADGKFPATLKLAGGATEKQILRAMNGHILAKGELIGRYQR